MKIKTKGNSYSSAMRSKISLALFDRYAKSPLSIRIPTALYPSSLRARATAQKFSKPLLKIKIKKNFKVSYKNFFGTTFQSGSGQFI